MIKTFCDRCGAECTNEDSEIVFGKELCEKCQEELSFWLSNTPTWKTKYDTLRRFCLDMFGREQTIRPHHC